MARLQAGSGTELSASRRLLSALVVAGIVVAGCASSTAQPTITSAGPSLPPAPIAVCAGPDVDWSVLPAVARAYGAAWNESDAARRLRFLEESWADQGSYVDVTMDVPVAGRAAFNDHIGGFQLAFPGHYFEPSAWSPTDEHHAMLRMRWRLCSATGSTVLVGEDIGELDDDGRFGRVVGWHE